MLQFISKLTSDHSVFFKRRRFGNNILTFVYFVIIESQDQNLKSRRLRESKETKRQLLQQERLESLYVLIKLFFLHNFMLIALSTYFIMMKLLSPISTS